MGQENKYSISIIIPVYNGEMYISDCLDSILNQSFLDLEIIIIDDGSTDSTARLLEEYQERDERIKLIKQQNKGPGAARNIGIQRANGYALMFMDSDDYYSRKDVIELVYKKWIDSDADILVFNGRAFIDNGTEDYKWHNSKYYSLDEKNEGRVEKGLYYIEQTNGQIQQPGMKICERRFVIENGIVFQESKCGVDLLFFYHLFIKAERVMYFDFVGYCRRYREDSIVTGTSINNVLVRLQSFIDLFSLVDIIEGEREAHIVKKQFLYYLCLLWVMAYNRQRDDRTILMNAFTQNRLAELLKENKLDFVTRVFYWMISMPKQLMFFQTAVAKFVRLIFRKKSNLFV